MQKQWQTGLVWLRRDLRLEDNAALAAAARACAVLHCVFVFDTEILEPLPRADRRVEFIRESLVALDARLREVAGHADAGLIVLHGAAAQALPALAQALGAQAVFAAQDYEPQAIARDAQVAQHLDSMGASMVLVKDHVVWQAREVLTQTGKPYSVFTPYMRAWLSKLEACAAAPDSPIAAHTCPSLAQQLLPRPSAWAQPVPSLAQLGFVPSNLAQLPIATGEAGAAALLQDFGDRMDAYDVRRNFPASKGPSYLSVHLRFGTVSIRTLVRMALARRAQGSAGAQTWLGELVWRDFYFQILANFPHVVRRAFKSEYDMIDWESGARAQALFAAWCEGRTGYPLVDAAMLQLQKTGYMHNRLRMVAGSFLVKHLGVDWRWGEQFFAQHLNDFDLSANNGGWQWVASSGCDAQPYFRIFNPIAQSEKFDAQGVFIKRYVPALAALSERSIHAPWLAKPAELTASGVVLGEGPGCTYPLPVVEHAQARARTLLRYAVVKNPSTLGV